MLFMKKNILGCFFQIIFSVLLLTDVGEFKGSLCIFFSYL